MKKNRKISRVVLGGAAIALLVFTVSVQFILLPQIAQAQPIEDFDVGEPGPFGQTPEFKAYQKELEAVTKPDTTTGGGGGGLGDKLAAGCGWLSTRPTCIIYWILDTISDFIVTIFVSLATWIFDAFIDISLLDLSKTPFVKLGFQITLGVANMFFVLILLWIAIATIFNFEPYTARSLLLKLIVAALLINFSLAIGGAIIQLSNGIAKIFYDELQKPFKTQITGKFISFPGTSIAERVMLMSNFAAIKDTTPKGRATVAELDQIIREGECEEIKEPELYGDLGAMVTKDIKCTSAKAEAAWRQRFATPENSSDTIATALSAIFWKLAITPILIFVLLAGSIFLLIRQLSLAFILVLGPLAFLFMILPATQRFYGDWWEKLFKWSFFFPAFMFFLFISLQVGGGLLPEDLKSSDQRLGITFQYLMTTVLLLGSLMVANQMGIWGANTVVGWGEKLGKATGKWAGRFAGRKILQAAAPLARGLEGGGRVAQALMRVPGVRRGLQRTAAAERAQVDTREKQLGKLASDELARRYGMVSTSQAERTAIASLLIQRKDIDRMTGDQVREVLRYMRTMGIDPTGLERAAPHQVGDDTEINRVISGMRPEHLERMDRTALLNEHVLRAVARNWRQGHFSKMMSFDPRMRNIFQQQLEGPMGQELIDSMDPATYDYFRTSPSQGFGWRLPEGHRPPTRWRPTEERRQPPPPPQPQLSPPPPPPTTGPTIVAPSGVGFPGARERLRGGRWERRNPQTGEWEPIT